MKTSKQSMKINEDLEKYAQLSQEWVKSRIEAIGNHINKMEQQSLERWLTKWKHKNAVRHYQRELNKIK